MQKQGHLDSNLFAHHDVSMRTTVTLDPDVERLLRETMHSSRQSFKQTLNAALRDGLNPKPASAKARRFVVKARPMGNHAGVDPAGFNKLADELEAADFMERTNRAARS
jgi:hypothetical protein